MSTATATATATATSSGSDCHNHKPEPKEMVFYYKIFTDSTQTQVNFSEFVNQTVPETYSGVSNFWMSNADGSVNKDQLITYIGDRVPPSESLELPALFNEVLNMNVKPFRDNYLQAACNYLDAGSGSVTSVDSNLFVVTAGSGMFKDSKTVLVEYNNTGAKTRKVTVRNY